MFGRRKKRSGFLPFVIFRFLLSLLMFGILLAGVYTAYKHFSGFDPISVNPKALITGFLSSGNFDALLKYLPIDLKKKQQIVYQSQTPETAKKEVKSVQINHGKLLFSFALIADVHNDNALLKKALEQIQDVSFIIGLGDYTDVGTLEELQNTKKTLDESKVRYFVIPGDHDLWDSRDKQKEPDFNFTQVFGSPWQSFENSGVVFLLLDNSDNYKGFGDIQIQRLQEELERYKSSGNIRFILAFVHEPLYHPSSDHIMGRIEPSLKDQAKKLTKMLKEAGVKKVFAGDIHFFRQYDDPETKL
ncbi:MAG: metallophosphoesterase, partial [Candidatus Daviesbacteria bacterium]|nr:metallophosphoesterase [Candidatus Daviesbacteria bacterium]